MQVWKIILRNYQYLPDTLATFETSRTVQTNRIGHTTSIVCIAFINVRTNLSLQSLLDTKCHMGQRQRLHDRSQDHAAREPWLPCESNFNQKSTSGCNPGNVLLNNWKHTEVIPTPSQWRHGRRRLQSFERRPPIQKLFWFPQYIFEIKDHHCIYAH